jgi:hypothetical protein
MEDDEFQKFVKEAWDNLDPGQRQTLVNQGWTLKSFDELMRKLMGTIAAWMGGCVFFAILSIIGAIGMLKLRRRGLAITAAILTTIPGVTCLSCALIGEGIGIWCMVVLFSSDVSAGFAANRAEADAPPDDAWPTDRGSEGFRE